MITIVLSYNREIMTFIVKDREIWYSDRVFKQKIRCIPADEKLKQKIIMSRNKIPKFLEQFYNLPEKDKQEYENAKDDNELADIIVKDAKSKGCLLIKQETKDDMPN